MAPLSCGSSATLHTAYGGRILGLLHWTVQGLRKVGGSRELVQQSGVNDTRHINSGTGRRCF